MKHYMPGLDGLRTIAVIAVLLFHAFPHALPGGFIGVDVFFVLSGYIITKTYFEALRTERVSLKEFYIKRFRRLAPAYIVVLAVTTIAAYFLIPPLYLKNFSESLAAQPFYLQNIVFWSQGDYFESPLTKPLLHTWSLAVEEQFYVVYGLLILLVRRTKWLSVPLLIALLALLALGSFAANYIVSAVSPKTAFFWLPTRIWELAIGVMLALYAREAPLWMAPYLKWGGLAAIIAAIVLFDESAGSQTIQAVIACLGTAAVISAVAALKRKDLLLDQPGVAYIGKISYSLYLWHWPIISIATIYLGQNLSTLQATAALGLTCFFSVLSYRYVEVPVRSKLLIASNARLLGSVAVSTVLTVAVSILFIRTDGAVYRYPADLATLYSAEQKRSPYRCPVIDRIMHPSSEMCQRNQVISDVNLLIVGDSHADQLDELIARLGQGRNVGVFLTTRNCNLHEFGADAYCSEEVLAKILAESKKRNIRNIVGISFFKKDFNGEKKLHDTLSQAISNDAGIEHLFIMQVVPNNPYFNPREWINVREKGTQQPKIYTLAEYLSDNDRLIAALNTIKGMDGRIKILDPSPYICESAACEFASNGTPNYFDSHHLSPTGVQLLTPLFTDAISVIANDGKIAREVSASPMTVLNKTGH
jgi:peptidoglycan/LPS O-acetylase OafA/YrhL